MKNIDYHAKTDEEVRIIFDPYRRKILKTYLSSDEPLTAKKVADILEEPPSKVHYHIMKLLKIGVLKLAKTKNINGIIAKYYNTEYTGFHMDTSRLSKESLDVVKHEGIKAFDRQSNNFFKDLQKHYDLVDALGDEANRMMVLREFKLYMTEAEQLEVIKKFSEILYKYSVKDDTKEIYSSLMCLARIE